MIGQTISHYKILEKLGEGGMGVVYKAEDTKLKRIVALKFLPKEYTRDEDAKERFSREAQAAAGLNHANIVTIHEIDEHDDQIYIVMEYVDGKTLKELIASDPLPLKEVIDITNQICDGLDTAHERGIVHRDIKPQNILVDKDGKVRILDFGLAKLRGMQQLTKESSTLGTVHYMSPEQAKGGEVDKRSDIWSLGVILYEMITGKLPFDAEYEQALVYSIINETPEPVESIRPDVSRQVSKIVEILLNKSSDQRFPSCSEIQRLLKIVTDEDPDTQFMKPVSGSSKSNLFKKLSIGLVPIAVILLLVLTIGKLLFKPSAKISESQKKSIAVLPFKNMSENQKNEYFCDGITEDIITQLSKINDLKVTSRTSVFYFKNKNAKINDIARELGVTNVLEGSVRHSKNRVRITVQLIIAETDTHLWAETYDREFKDIFAIQSDVANKIAKTLEITLFPELSKRMSKKPTENMAAYQLYLQGKYHWNKRTPEGLKKAVSFFEQAVALDPEYALGYSGLAEAYVVIGDLSVVWGTLYDENFKSAYSKAENYCLKALSLDSELAQAYASLGEIKCDWKWNFAGAEEALNKAIQLNPNYATAHQWLAEYYNAMGKVTLAKKSIAKARELDPFSIIIQYVQGRIYMADRQYEKSLEIFKNVLAKAPYFKPVHFVMSLAYMFNKSYDKALQHAEKSQPAVTQAFLRGRILVRRGGETAKLEKMLEESLSIPEIYEYPGGLAIIYADLGRLDEALKWYKKAIEKHSIFILTRHEMHRCDALNNDPRVKKILKDLGLK